MIELRDICLSFAERTLISNASARFACGTMTALLGRNGTGKSTLLRAIAALGKVQGGEVVVDGREISTLSSVELARRVAFVNTERIDVEALTVYDLVAVGRSPYTDWMGRLRADDERVIERSMQIAGVGNMARRMVATLSDGECQRVMIARALAQDTPIILLDEPTAPRRKCPLRRQPCGNIRGRQRGPRSPRCRPGPQSLSSRWDPPR